MAILIKKKENKMFSVFHSVHINGPYFPGGPFFERDGRPTTVGYYARDRAGNMATCNFNIYVKGKHIM